MFAEKTSLESHSATLCCVISASAYPLWAGFLTRTMRQGDNQIPRSSVQQVGRPCANLNQSNATALNNSCSRQKPSPGGELAGRTSPVGTSERRAPGAPSFLLALSRRPTCPGSLRKLAFRLSPRPEPPLPRPVQDQGRAAPHPLAAGGGGSRAARRCPAHHTARSPLAAGRGGPGSDWPAPPVHPALAPVTTLCPPGEFQVLPRPQPPPVRPGTPWAALHPHPPTRSPSAPEAQGPDAGEPGEAARKFCSAFAAGAGAPRCAPRSSTPPT